VIIFLFTNRLRLLSTCARVKRVECMRAVFVWIPWRMASKTSHVASGALLCLELMNVLDATSSSRGNIFPSRSLCSDNTTFWVRLIQKSLGQVWAASRDKVSRYSQADDKVPKKKKKTTH
jgi:hypothetical protein